MKWTIFLFFCISWPLIAGCNKSVKKNEENATLSNLRNKLGSWVDSGYYDGLAVRVVKDGDSFFESFYGGYADTTALHVASAGKWIVAATIAAIVDEGKLSWDDKVNKYLPEFRDLKGEATLRQLLSHTAGYPDYQPEGNRRDNYQTLEEASANILSLPANTIPGTEFFYGGLSMQVAGRMAEIATGEDWETLFQSKIAHPLHMKFSFFVPVSEEPGFNPMLGGGFKTCLHDYMNFLNMITNNGEYNGNRILSTEVIEEIESDQVHNVPLASENYVFRSRQNSHNGIYGLGIWREEIDDNGKAILISSPGWAGSYPWIDRKNEIYGFIIAKVKPKAFSENFSSFYNSAILPIILREAIR